MNGVGTYVGSFDNYRKYNTSKIFRVNFGSVSSQLISDRLTSSKLSFEK